MTIPSIKALSPCIIFPCIHPKIKADRIIAIQVGYLLSILLKMIPRNKISSTTGASITVEKKVITKLLELIRELIPSNPPSLVWIIPSKIVVRKPLIIPIATITSPPTIKKQYLWYLPLFF